MTDQTNKSPIGIVPPPPTSKFIGMIVGQITGTIYSVINPNSDRELDNPRFLLLTNPIGEPVMMDKIPREFYFQFNSLEQLGQMRKKARDAAKNK